MRLKFHKSIFLFKLLGFCVLMLLLHRVLFLSLFHGQFSDVPRIEFVKAFLIGTLTDAISVIYFLLPMWLFLLFGNIQNAWIRRLSLFWFIIGFVMVCVLNIADLGYYPITKKRMGAELLDILPEVPALMKAYLKDYWYLFMILICFLTFTFWWIRKQLIEYQETSYGFKFKAVNVIIILFLFFSIMRGGYGKRPFMPFDIPSIVDPRLQWLASNTPFQFLHTLENENLPTENYFDEAVAEQNIHLEKKPNSISWHKKNILFIILESFSTERIGLFNPAVKSYTPFLDSLLSKSRTYNYGMANGRMTIDALPSVLSGIPSFMEKNYCYSNYNNNMVHGVGKLLEQEGYQTAFYYGGLKSTFGFENFINLNFSNNYIAQEDFDQPYENSGWGVDDHLYLPFVAKKLNSLKQPFCASLLTLSLHHPFPIPEPYKSRLDSIKDPVKKSMKYTDLSLQLFFNEISKADWYENSVIAICADHTSSGFGNFENNVINEFCIPVSFHAVGDTSFNIPQEKSISQIDMYPTILDYLGYNKSYVSLGNSALNHQTYTVQYLGNGVFTIFKYPYALEYDNTSQKVNRFMKYQPNRTLENIEPNDSTKQEFNDLTTQIKSYIQVFSFRVNKNQF